MSFRIHKTTRAAALAATLVLCALTGPSPAFAQSDDVDPEVRIQQLENQLRQLTGQNEELQYRNRQLEERLRMLQSGAPGSPQGAVPGQPGAPMTNTAAMPPVQQAPPYPQQPPAGGYQSQVAAPAPIAQEPAGPRSGRRGDAFDPTQNPNAPGAPRALGGGQLPVPS
jgi:TolA-binding protein